MKKLFLFTFCCCGLVAHASPHNDSLPLAGDPTVYTNPVFNHDFPDPNLVKGKDGFFYAYSTQTNWTADGIAGGQRIIKEV